MCANLCCSLLIQPVLFRSTTPPSYSISNTGYHAGGYPAISAQCSATKRTFCLGATSISPCNATGDLTSEGSDEALFFEDCHYFPSSQPSTQPSSQPSVHPTNYPSSKPSMQPSSQPSQPSSQPTGQPSCQPSSSPSSEPTQPTSRPTTQPFMKPSSVPSNQPTATPSMQPATIPSSQPSMQPYSVPSSNPSVQPSSQPSQPSSQPSVQPSGSPSSQPSTYLFCDGAVNNLCVGGSYCNSSQCTTCDAGYECGDGLNRTACVPGSFSSAGASLCSPCGQGTYSVVPATVTCQSCASGTYYNGTGGTNVSVCTPCEIGTFQNSSGSATCGRVPEGKRMTLHC